MADIEYLHKYRGPKHTSIAKKLKDPVNEEVLEKVAEEMSESIPEDVILVPVPSSSGENKATLVLALKIASLIEGAKVVEAIKRVKPVQSSYLRRRQGLTGLSIKEHIKSMKQVKKILPRKEVWIIDNIVTSGNTINAMEYHIGREVNALVYADAGRIPKKNPSEGNLVVTISGSRDFKHLKKIDAVLDTLPPGTIIYHGGARGVDMYADKIARQKGFQVEIFYPEWERYGKAAGQIRNREMIDNSDMLIAFWDEVSPGTAGAIRHARKINLDYKVILDT